MTSFTLLKVRFKQNESTISRPTALSVRFIEPLPDLGRSLEHQRDPKLMELLPVLYETFLVNCWNERSRITPVR